MVDIKGFSRCYIARENKKERSINKKFIEENIQDFIEKDFRIRK